MQKWGQWLLNGCWMRCRRRRSKIPHKKDRRRDHDGDEGGQTRDNAGWGKSRRDMPTQPTRRAQSITGLAHMTDVGCRIPFFSDGPKLAPWSSRRAATKRKRDLQHGEHPLSEGRLFWRVSSPVSYPGFFFRHNKNFSFRSPRGLPHPFNRREMIPRRPDSRPFPPLCFLSGKTPSDIVQAPFRSVSPTNV